METEQLQVARRIVDMLPGLAANLRLAGLFDHSGRDLTPRQLLALFVVRESGDRPVRTGELAELLGVSGPSVTALVDRLVVAGFLQRARGSDRRVVLLTLSQRGRSLLETLSSGLIDRIGAVLASMDASARTRLELALNEVAAFAKSVRRVGVSLVAEDVVA